MPWVKLDDAFHTNPKVMRAGLSGRALYIAGLCYCAAGLTDGTIPLVAITKLGSLADVRKPLEAARTLVTVGLWESTAGGYQVHDYLKYQPSAEDVRKERERVASWRAERRTERVRNAVPNGVPDAYETRSERRPARTASRPGPAGILPDPARPESPPQPPLLRKGGRSRKSRSRIEFDEDGPRYEQRTGADGTRKWVEVS